MEYPQKFAGKWVALKKDKPIDSGKSLKTLHKRIQKREDHAQIGFTFVPKGHLAGEAYGI